MAVPVTDRIAIVGYGEVGAILARDLGAAGATEIIVSDIDPAATARARARESFLSVAADNATAVEAADVVFVCVTAAAVIPAMEQCSPGLRHGPLLIDLNSVAPATKQRAAAIVEAAGGGYVEAAVMTSVPPNGLRSPMLLGGPHTAEFIAWGAAFDMNLTAFSDHIGPASAVKMCRSVVIKGLEALLTESMLAARHYDVTEDVLATLHDTLPNTDWPRLARYMIGRSLLHGTRRAEEMAEVAVAVSDAGVAPLMSDATARRQSWAGCRGRELSGAADAPETLDALLDQIAGAIGSG